MTTLFYLLVVGFLIWIIIKNNDDFGGMA